jgi:hypothetical protein
MPLEEVVVPTPVPVELVEVVVLVVPALMRLLVPEAE